MSHDITTDGYTVWVNEAGGFCLGRFSCFGIDVHKGAAAQMQGGSECLDCTHGATDIADWRRFQASMQWFHGVTVDGGFLPVAFREETP